MKNSLLIDVNNSFDYFRTIRKARKSGVEAVKVSIQPVKTIPVMNVGVGFLNTVEGCVLYNLTDRSIYNASKNAFHGLTYEVQYRLTGIPEDGEFIERVNFWRELLQPIMLPKQYRIAMMRILHWYIHIKHLRQSGEIQ